MARLWVTSPPRQRLSRVEEVFYAARQALAVEKATALGLSVQFEVVDGYLDCAIDGTADRVATLLKALAAFGLEEFTVDVETEQEEVELRTHLRNDLKVDICLEIK